MSNFDEVLNDLVEERIQRDNNKEEIDYSDEDCSKYDFSPPTDDNRKDFSLPAIPAKLTVNDLTPQKNGLSILELYSRHKLRKQEKSKTPEEKPKMSILEMYQTLHENIYSKKEDASSEQLEMDFMPNSVPESPPKIDIKPLIPDVLHPTDSFEIEKSPMLKTENIEIELPSVKIPEIDLSYFEFLPSKLPEVPKEIKLPKIKIPKKRLNNLIDLDFINFNPSDNESSDEEPEIPAHEPHEAEYLTPECQTFEIPSEQFKKLSNLPKATNDNPIQLNVKTNVMLKDPLVYCGLPFETWSEHASLLCKHNGCVRCRPKKILKQGFSSVLLRKIKEQLREKYHGHVNLRKVPTDIFSSQLFK